MRSAFTKATGMLVMLSMVLSCFAAMPITASADAGFNNDLNMYNLGNLNEQDGWLTAGTSGYTTNIKVVQDPIDINNKYIQVYDKNGDKTVSATRNFAPVDGTGTDGMAVVEFSFFPTKYQNYESGIQIKCGDNVVIDLIGKYISSRQMLVLSQPAIGDIAGGTPINYELAQWSGNSTWYQLKFILNFNTKTFNVYCGEGTVPEASSYSNIPFATADCTFIDNFFIRNRPQAEFKVSGTKIIDPNGNEFVVKGTNVNGPYWPWKRETTQDATKIVDLWKFNTIRVSCFPRLEYAKVSNYQNLDNIVNTFTAKKAVVMIENHDVTGKYPEASAIISGLVRYPSLEEMKTWWIDMANKYKDNPYVWFNLMNEPGKGSYSVADSMNKWELVNIELIAAIRSTGAKNIIVCDAHIWASEDGYRDPSASVILAKGESLIAQDKNLVFSTHCYEAWSDTSIRLDNFIDAVRAKNLCMIIGEYGQENPAISSAAQTVMNACVPKKVGRIQWSWASEDNFDLTLGTANGAGFEINKTDGTKPTNLNWLGDVIWDDNHETLVTPVTSTVPNILNGGFESGLKYWNDLGGSSIDTTNKTNGTSGLKLASGATSSIEQRVSMRTSATYKLSAKGKNSASPGTNASTLKVEYNIGGVWYFQTISFTETAFTYKEITFTIPAGDMGDHRMVITKKATNVNFYIDEVNLVKQ